MIWARPRFRGRTAILDPVILRFAVLTYLVVLPVGHLFPMPINGRTVVGSDIMLALVLLAGLIDLGRMSVPYFRGEGERLPVLPGQSAFHLAALFMWIFGTWVGLGALWSFYPAYATTKGLAFAALGLGALAILWCGGTEASAGRRGGP